MTPYFRLTKLGRELRKAGNRVPLERPYVVWVLRYKDAHGRLVRKASKVKTEAQAILATAQAEKEEEDIAAGRAGRRQLSRATWEEVRDTYLELRPELATHAPFRSMLRVWLDPFFKGEPVAAITPAECGRLLAKARREGLAASTCRQLFVRAHAIFQHAVEVQRVLESNPWAALERPQVQQKDPVWLTHAQVVALLEGAGEARLMFLCAVLTGLRRGEVAGLRWEDVDFEHGELGAIVVRRSFGRERVKGKRVDIVPLHPRLREELLAARARATGPLVFPSPRTGGVRSETWHAAEFLRRVAERAGVQLPEGCTFHSLRKTFGTHLGTASKDVVATQRLVRHASVETTTQVYFGRDVAHLEGAIRTLPAFDAHTSDTRPAEPPAAAALPRGRKGRR